MADKKTNPFMNMLGHVAMGIGGGLTGHDYLGTFYKWKEAQEEKEKTDWEEEYYKSAALGEGYEPPNRGVVPSTAVSQIAPPVMPSVNRVGAVPSVAEGASQAFQDYLGKPQLKPQFGAIGKKYAGYDPLEITAPQETTKRQIEFMSDVGKSKITNKTNLNLVAGNMFDLSNWLTKAYKEGGAGSKYKAFAANLAREGWLPEGMSEKFASSAAVFGKRFEIIGKMFPMITQQLGKEGSVRLIESIFSRIGKTIPDLHTAPKLAVKEMEATVESMYRISRALEQVDLSGYNLKNSAQMKSFIDDIAKVTNELEVTGEERKLLNRLKSKSTEPIRDYIKGRDTKSLKDKYGLD